MKRSSSIFFLGSICSLLLHSVLTSCNTRVSQSISSNENLPQSLKVKYINGGEFEIYSAQSQNVRKSCSYFHLEGDGFAWKSRTSFLMIQHQKNAVATKLAIKENKPDTIYLCKTLSIWRETLRKKCSQIYWSSHRYSPEIIESVSRAITILKNNNNKTIRLIGFSGGGAIAVLVAARRDDVGAIYTVAGNLNSKLIMERHK